MQRTPSAQLNKVKNFKVRNNPVVRAFTQLKRKQNYEKLHHQILVALPRAFCSIDIDFGILRFNVANIFCDFSTLDLCGTDYVVDIPAHIQKVVEISVFIHNGSANGNLFYLPVMHRYRTNVQPRP